MVGREQGEAATGESGAVMAEREEQEGQDAAARAARVAAKVDG